MAIHKREKQYQMLPTIRVGLYSDCAPGVRPNNNRVPLVAVLLSLQFCPSHAWRTGEIVYRSFQFRNRAAHKAPRWCDFFQRQHSANIP